MAAMANYDDATEMVETMMEHGSIAKAIRVYEHSAEPSGDATKIAKEYCQFMALKILSGDFSADDAKLSPGGVIDEFWHCHVLDTVGYPEFFKDVFPPLGPIVHHDPEKALDDQDEIKARQEKTKEVYQHVFKGVCPFFKLSGKKRSAGAARADTEMVFIRNPFTLFLKDLNGRTDEVEMGPDNTVRHLQMVVRDKTGVLQDQQRLIFAGKQLYEDGTLASYGIGQGATIHLVLRLTGC